MKTENFHLQTSRYQQAHTLFQRGLDLLFPPRCAGCQQSGSLLCPACLRNMQPLATPCCQRCGAPLAQSADNCTSCQWGAFHLHGLRCVNLYQGALRNAIHALKYQGQPRLAEPLGLLLAEAFTRYGLHADALIPLPLHPQRQQQRGYNQATLLARVCATHLKVPCLEGGVIRQRATRVQVGLSTQERQQNVLGAFALTSDAQARLFAYHRVVLIDDVATTGATLEACAAPLYAAGMHEVWGLVLARPVNLIQDTTQGVL
jgi:ComF family protein